MNHLHNKIIFAGLLSIFCSSCNNKSHDDFQQNLTGDYTGTFSVVYSDGMTKSNTASISFTEGNTYSSSGNGNKNDFYPAGGKGTYEMDRSTITFRENDIWLAHFDWNLILEGTYNYEKNGDYLTISANKNDIGVYKYVLKKESE